MIPTKHFTAFADRLRGLTGWRRLAAAILTGMVGASAFPPLNFVPIFWLCFPVFLFLLQGTKTWRQAFFTGWAFSFGLLMLGLYWIAASMFVDIKQFWWAVPLSVAGLPAMFSFYYGVAMVGAWKFGTRGLSGVLAAGLFWFLGDVARGNMFSGFPWDLEGYAWSAVLPVLQITSITGVYGLTLITVVAAFLPALLAEKAVPASRVILASFLVLLALAGWGEWRLLTHPTETVSGVRLRIVQPNVDQVRKWNNDEREPDFRQLLKFSALPGAKPVTHIIWPETAATFYLSEDPEHREIIADNLPAGASLITGVIRRELNDAGQVIFHNSLVAIDGSGEVTAEYDKHHLVPFGEYIPYRSLLGSVHPLIHLGVDFTPGESASTLRVAGLPPFSPLICYEVIFSGDVVPQNDRPQLLLNVTNDGWYGRTAGPYQHFAMARVRAIEEGLPLVRSANTGISGVTDAYGRVTARLSLGMPGFVDADLPKALAPTVFSRVHEIPAGILFVFVSCVALYLRHRRR